MSRFFGLFGLLGLSGGFLVISAPLRESLLGAAGRGWDVVQAHEPYSYAGLAAFLFLVFWRYMYRSSQPR